VTTISLKDVRALIEQTKDQQALKMVDDLLGLVILLSPTFAGPAGVAALGLLDPKSEMIKIVGRHMGRLTGGASFTDKCASMNAAYCLNVFVAFFTALDEKLPEVAKLLDLSGAERAVLVSASQELVSDQDETPLPDKRVQVPNAVRDLNAEADARDRIYQTLSDGVSRFLRGLASWESLKHAEQMRAEVALDTLPKLAERAFQGLHLALVAEYPEFMAWNSERDRVGLIASIEKAGLTISGQQALFVETAHTLDVGLSKLTELVASMAAPAVMDDQSRRIAEQLHALYTAAVARPVIVDSAEEGGGLKYPAKAAAYIPQAFKAVEHRSGGSGLEDEATWKSLETQEDIALFVVSYLQSQDCLQSPLLLLGQPGSGKSLLTEMLAARLGPPNYNTVRVPLRDVYPDDSIQTQIEKRVKEDLGRTVDWADFSDGVSSRPPLVILDGFDELLQASGRVFGSYLEDVARFQQRESDLGRPVRVIITSRISLIDRARVPNGSTVVRLMEFDGSRRTRWSEVWNSENEEYFRSDGVEPFVPPTNPKLVHLAEQPLLLLMLALYDSDGNALANHDEIDQSSLYHSLLVRFLVRERVKGKAAADFNSLTISEREDALENDLARLGVAAMGMFNRQAVHIGRDDLNADIDYFNAGRKGQVEKGVALAEADLLLGSFFFIHESKAASGTVADDLQPAAFEFLHNTFGEFLTADFLLRHLSNSLRAVHKLSKDPGLREMYDKSLDALAPHLLACLSRTSLPSRPVVVDMLSEWYPRRRLAVDMAPEEFSAALDALVSRQIEKLLVDPTPPSLVDGAPIGMRPAYGGASIFSMNLVVLAAIMTPGGYKWSDERYQTDGGVRAWERLGHLWRGWFNLDSMRELASVLRVTVTADGLVLSGVERNERTSVSSRLALTAEVAETVRDLPLAAMSRLLLWERGDSSPVELDKLKDGLEQAQILEADTVAIREVWLDGSAEGPSLASPAAGASYLAQRSAALRTLGDYAVVRERLGPDQWSMEGSGRVPGHALEGLFELNAAVEPRFIHLVIDRLDDRSVNALRTFTVREWDAILPVLLPYWHLSAVGRLLGMFQKQLRAPDDMSLKSLVSIAVLADRWHRRTLYNFCIDAIVGLLQLDSERLLSVGMLELDELVGVLTERARAKLTPGERACALKIWEVVDDARGRWAEAALPEALYIRARRLMRAIVQRPLEPSFIYDLYAVTADELLVILVALHALGEVGLLRRLVSSNDSRRRDSLAALFKRLQSGLIASEITGAEGRALQWALDSAVSQSNEP
jgi:hypothetical protein